MSNIELHHEDEWSAVYMDGKLVDGPGDTYLRYEWLMAHFNVKEVQDGAFMRGQTQSRGVAKTLQEVEEYRTAKEAREARALELRAQADELRAQADRLLEEAVDDYRPY